MTSKLSNELREALAKQDDQPLQVEDPDTHAKYVIVRMEVYEEMQKLLPYDLSEPDPREFLPMMHEVMKEDWDAPGMEKYDDYQPPQRD